MCLRAKSFSQPCDASGFGPRESAVLSEDAARLPSSDPSQQQADAARVARLQQSKAKLRLIQSESPLTGPPSMRRRSQVLSEYESWLAAEEAAAAAGSGGDGGALQVADEASLKVSAPLRPLLVPGFRAPASRCGSRRSLDESAILSFVKSRGGGGGDDDEHRGEEAAVGPAPCSSKAIRVANRHSLGEGAAVRSVNSSGDGAYAKGRFLSSCNEDAGGGVFAEEDEPPIVQLAPRAPAALRGTATQPLASRSASRRSLDESSIASFIKRSGDCGSGSSGDKERNSDTAVGVAPPSSKVLRASSQRDIDGQLLDSLKR